MLSADPGLPYFIVDKGVQRCLKSQCTLFVHLRNSDVPPLGEANADHVPDFNGELLQAERLGQEIDAAVAV